MNELSAHFALSEFQCPCCGQVQVSDKLISMLEQLYTLFDCSKIIVNSGYRCPEHDKAVGGSGTGQHTLGNAADVVCYAPNGDIISSKDVCCVAQDLGFPGIANINAKYKATHLDVRESGTYYGDEIYGTHSVTDDFYAYFYGEGKTVSALKGIDVSHHQGTIDWDKVDVDFAIIRAGYGREASQVDTQFEANYAGCTRRGIPCGAYWYSYATTAAEAKKEAQVCLDTIKGKSFLYPIFYDIEEEKSLKCADEIASAFCTALENAGYYAGIYSYKSALESSFSSTTRQKYDTWLAHVDVAQTTYTGNYGIWQYSWKGSVSGITGDVDLDYAYKDYPSIMAKNGLNNVGETVEETDTLTQILEHVASIDEKLGGGA